MVNKVTEFRDKEIPSDLEYMQGSVIELIFDSYLKTGTLSSELTDLAAICRNEIHTAMSEITEPSAFSYLSECHQLLTEILDRSRKRN